MIDPNDIPPLRDIISQYDLGAKKSLGQHFLLDLNITRKIARISGLTEHDTVLEIGPGPGGLTRALLETGAQVIVVERDSRCIDVMESLSAYYPGKMTIIEADAMKIDELAIKNEYATGQNFHIASNLPYNISTELLIKWLTKKDPSADKNNPKPFWHGMTLMFQKEVGDRILAAHGNKTFGRLGILAQSLSLPVKGFDLPARAFTPPPKVDSSVLHFTNIPEPDYDVPTLEKITAAAFSQRRKMLRSSLKSIFGAETESILAAQEIKPTARSEDITVEDFQKLARYLSQ